MSRSASTKSCVALQLSHAMRILEHWNDDNKIIHTFFFAPPAGSLKLLGRTASQNETCGSPGFGGRLSALARVAARFVASRPMSFYRDCCASVGEMERKEFIWASLKFE